MPIEERRTIFSNFPCVIIFLVGLRPRPLGRKERTLWREAKGFLVRGLGRGANPFPIRAHAKRESLLLNGNHLVIYFMVVFYGVLDKVGEMS